MKKNTFYVCAGLSLMLAFGSCSKEKAAGNTTTNGADAVSAAFSSGTWVISSFTQKTEDKAGKFGGVAFTFHADGSAVASDNSQEVQGSWHHSPAVTYYGSTSKEAMYLNFGTSKPFDLLSKTWNVTARSANTISLESPETAEDEHLQFNKQ